jgi:hypothetical protein
MPKKIRELISMLEKSGFTYSNQTQRAGFGNVFEIVVYQS